MSARRRPEDGPVVRAHCHDCNVVEVEPAQVRLLLRQGAPSGYSFDCPSCGAVVSYDGISGAKVALLIAAGAVVIDLSMECLEYLGRPPLSEADAELFTRSIEHLSFLAAFAGRERQAYRRALIDPRPSAD